VNKIKFLNFNLDSIGFSASFICAIHCATLPLLLTSISASKLGFLANPVFEIFMIILSVIIGVSSLLPSYKQHKKIIPIAFLLLGFSMIFSGHFIVSEDFESVVTPLGAFIVAYSHLANWKLSEKDCNDCVKNTI
jgi:hypothetical protein